MSSEDISQLFWSGSQRLTLGIWRDEATGCWADFFFLSLLVPGLWYFLCHVLSWPLSPAEQLDYFTPQQNHYRQQGWAVFVSGEFPGESRGVSAPLRDVFMPRLPAQTQDPGGWRREFQDPCTWWEGSSSAAQPSGSCLKQKEQPLTYVAPLWRTEMLASGSQE